MYREKKKNLHMVSLIWRRLVIPKELIWWVLKKKGLKKEYIDAIKNMVDGYVTIIGTLLGK